MNNIVQSLFPDFSGNMAKNTSQIFTRVADVFTASTDKINIFAQQVQQLSEAMQLADQANLQVMNQASLKNGIPPENWMPETPHSLNDIIARFDHIPDGCLTLDDWEVEFQNQLEQATLNGENEHDIFVPYAEIIVGTAEVLQDLYGNENGVCYSENPPVFNTDSVENQSQPPSSHQSESSSSDPFYTPSSVTNAQGSNIESAYGVFY